MATRDDSWAEAETGTPPAPGRSASRGLLGWLFRRRSTSEGEIARELAAAMARSHDFRESLAVILRAAAIHLGARAATAVVETPTSGKLHRFAVREGRLEETLAPPLDPLAALCKQAAGIISRGALAQSSSAASAVERMAELRAELATPFRAGPSSLGYLALGAKRSGKGYTPEELGFVELLAHHGAIAIDRALAHAAVGQVVRNLPWPVAVFDRQLVVKYANAAFRKAFCPRDAEPEGRRLFDLLELEASHAEEGTLRIDSLGWHRESLPGEWRLQDRILEYQFFQMASTPDAVGQVGLVVRDVTLERDIQGRLFQSEKLASIGTLAAGVAHEVNNPLHGIMHLAELITEVEPGAQARESATKIAHLARSAARIVNELKVFSRSSRPVDAEDLDLAQVLQEAVDLVGHLEEAQGVDMRWELSATRPVRAVRSDLQQVFVNLLKNAFQALGGKGSITVRLEQSDAFVKAELKDDGPGIPLEHQPRLFEPFFTTKPVGKGTGLGLSICHRLVSNAGGRIEVRSTPGQGTSVAVLLPFSPPGVV